MTFQSSWEEIEGRLLRGRDGGLSGLKLRPAVRADAQLHPFGPTLIYCGIPGWPAVQNGCKALFEVTRTGDLCCVTLF